MNRKEYKEYQAAVAAFFELEGITNLTKAYNEDEPDYTYRACDCCGTCGKGLVIANGWSPASSLVKPYWCCNACLLYCETGELDDMTMLSIAE